MAGIDPTVPSECRTVFPGRDSFSHSEVGGTEGVKEIQPLEEMFTGLPSRNVLVNRVNLKGKVIRPAESSWIRPDSSGRNSNREASESRVRSR